MENSVDCVTFHSPSDRMEQTTTIILILCNSLDWSSVGELSITNSGQKFIPITRIHHNLQNYLEKE